MNPLQLNPPKTGEKALPTPALQPDGGLSPSPANIKLLGIIVLVVLVVAVVLAMIPRWRQREALRAETRELAIPTVSVASPALDKASEGLTLPAEVRAYMESAIYARANGYVKRWLVDLGAHVKAGQLLAEIDTPEINQDLARARAQLAEAEAALVLAKTTAARWTGLLKTVSVSEQEAAEKQADLALKSATVGAAEAGVHRLEELQSFGRVTAPFEGHITLRRTEVGELTAPGGTRELFRLAQTHVLRVFVHVPQALARAVAPGQLAELILPDFPGRAFQAKVVRAAGVMSADSRTLLTELEVENSHGEILAGSYAQVRLLETKAEAVLTLPSNALLFRAEGTQVGVVTAENKVELRTVSLGRDFGQKMEVLAGISPRDRVILNPADSLVNGTTVRVATPAENAAAK